MQLKPAQTKVAVVFVAIFVVGLGYFVWTRSVTPDPVIPPGQSLKNPLGVGPASRSAGRQGVNGAPAGITAQDSSGTRVDVPAPGTVDPKRGFGPSKGAPIPDAR